MQCLNCLHVPPGLVYVLSQTCRFPTKTEVGFQIEIEYINCANDKLWSQPTFYRRNTDYKNFKSEFLPSEAT